MNSSKELTYSLLILSIGLKKTLFYCHISHTFQTAKAMANIYSFLKLWKVRLATWFLKIKLNLSNNCNSDKNPLETNAIQFYLNVFSMNLSIKNSKRRDGLN